MNISLEQFIKNSIKEFYQLTTDYTKTYNLLKICRIHKYYHFGYYVGKLLEPADDYKFLDELSICAYWIGEYRESYNLTAKCLAICPESERARIMQNQYFSAVKLGICMSYNNTNNNLTPKTESFNLEVFKERTKSEISKLNYKKYWYQFTDKEKLGIGKELKDIENYFKIKLDLEIYPVYGTLLGIIRENDFIGWDTDIDMAYLSKYHTKEEVMREFNNLCNNLSKDNLLDYRIKTMSHLHVWSPQKKLRIDLWISWIDEKGQYHLVWTINGDISANIILPFKTVIFKGQTFRQMNNPILFLNEQYTDWNIPKDGTASNWAKRAPRWELENWHGK